MNALPLLLYRASKGMTCSIWWLSVFDADKYVLIGKDIQTMMQSEAECAIGDCSFCRLLDREPLYLKPKN